MPSHLVPFVTFVVKRGEGKDVEEEERSTDGDRHAQFCRVIPGVAREGRESRRL